MKIETIIYDTTRQLTNVSDKLSIASIFLFCEKLDSLKLAELLYTDNQELFIDELSQEFESYDIDLSINFSDKNIRNSFYLTLEGVKNQIDKDGYLKALYNKDEFALVINDICNYDFDKKEMHSFTINLSKQLSFDF